MAERFERKTSPDAQLDAGSTDALLETGLGYVRVLEDPGADFDAVSAAAADLRALVTRLELAEPNERLERAVRRFEAVLERYARRRGRQTAIGLSVMAGLAAVVAWIAARWLSAA